MHSADYDTTYDPTNKKVALIGVGASGLQILPKIQPIAKQVFHYARSRTWVLPVGIGQGVLASQGGDRMSKSAVTIEFIIQNLIDTESEQLG